MEGGDLGCAALNVRGSSCVPGAHGPTSVRPSDAGAGDGAAGDDGARSEGDEEMMREELMLAARH